MAILARLEWAESIPIDHKDDPKNPIVSVDRDGRVLSRLCDRTWTFPGGRINPSARQNVVWACESRSCERDAKQLAMLRLCHGKAMGLASVMILCNVMARLAEFCESKGVEVAELRRHPNVVIDFCQEKNTVSRKQQIIAAARLAIGTPDALGWEFLDPDQIRAIEEIQELEANQFPVIPSRIVAGLDSVAAEVLTSYLAISGDMEEACLSWLGCSYKPNDEGVSANWRKHLAKWPNLYREIFRWSDSTIVPIKTYVGVVRSAAYWEIASGSTARFKEILALEEGCLTKEQVGTRIAFVLRSMTTKTQASDNALWIAAPRVELAVKVLERLNSWYRHVHRNPPSVSRYLFQVYDYTLGRRQYPSQKRKRRLNYGEASFTCNFTWLTSATDAVITEADWAEAKRLTPTLDEARFAIGRVWEATGHQVRRTVLVRAAASGLVSQDSLSFQAKHQTWQMTSYYIRNYWHLVVSDPNNPIVKGTRREDAEAFAAIYAKSYNQAIETVLASKRFFSPYGMDHKREIVDAVPLLSLKDIKAGRAAEVLMRNTLGLCAQGEYCEWQSSLSVRGCLTKASGRACSKAIIDAEHLPELHALREDLAFRKESLRVTDTFAQSELEADISAVNQAIALIENQEKYGQ